LFINAVYRKYCCCAFLLVSMLLASCTYSPPRIYTNIENVRAQAGSHIIAVSVTYQLLRDPTGINTFPNGGVPKLLDEKAKIYLCDVDTLEIRRVASISPSSSVKSTWQPWILGWANGSLFFQVMGRSGTRLKDFQNLNTVIYQVDPDGKLSEAKEAPRGITFQHNTGPLPQGIFVRVSRGHNMIDIKTEKHKEWQTMFKIDNAKGELISVKK